MAKIKIPYAGTVEIHFSYKFTPEERIYTTRQERSPRKKYNYNPEESPKTITPARSTVDEPQLPPNILILYIKADEAKPLIETIKKKGALYEGAESTLFVSTMKMWVGNDEQYDNSLVRHEFTRSENIDSFVKEYDYVVMRFTLANIYKGYRKGDDSYDRNMFFTNICQDKITLVECSNRLSFNENYRTDAFDVY